MNLGLAIFTSTIIACLTLLYINTKNMWNWRIIGRTLQWITVLAVLLILLAFVFVSIHSYIDTLPKKLTKFHGVKLGDTKQEVLDGLGNPSSVKNYTNHHVLTYYFKESGFGGLYGKMDSENVYISANDRVFEVTYQQGEGSVWNKYEYGGHTSVWDQYDRSSDKLWIKKKYGNPEITMKSSNEDTVRWEYPKYNMYFEFKGDDNQVFISGVYDPKYKRERWEK